MQVAVQADDVRCGEQFVDVAEPSLVPPRRLLVDLRIGCQHLEAEGAGATTDSLTDAAEPDQAQRPAGEALDVAYLVPALLSGARTLLSTATKTLQDQLFVRDLPRLRTALELPVTVALLKGRSSYLCLHRLGRARQDAHLPDRFAVRALAKVEAWAQTTTSGDLAELEGLDERSSVVPLVTSSRENCLGSECPDYRQCHVMKARREAMLADLVVVNHHLFFADMALRDSGVAELLPSVEVAIFDEAHQLGEAGVQFLGTILGSSQLIDFARDMLAAGLQQARGLLPWPELASACDRSARDLRLAAVGRLGEVRAGLKLRWTERSGEAGFVAALEQVGEACEAARAALESVPSDRAAALLYRDGAFELSVDGNELDVQLVDRLGHEGISYTPDWDEAVRAVDEGQAEVAVLMRPTRIEDVFAVAQRGETMPQKSTYFYPKLVSGLLFLPL